MPKRTFKRVLVISDPHCGATTGLTPGEFEASKDLKPHQTRRQELWGLFYDQIKKLGHINNVIIVGDVIHGPAKGRLTDENLANEPATQKRMAIKMLNYVNADHGLIVHGTPWHVDDNAVPIEHEIALDMSYDFHKIAEEYEINGLRFHIKHKIGGSNDPRTLGNVLAKEYETVLHNHERHNVPTQMPHILLRGHRHVYHMRGDEQWIGFMLPCLQTWGSNIAVDMTSVYYPTIGLMWFDIYNDQNWKYEVKIWRLKSHQEKPM